MATAEEVPTRRCNATLCCRRGRAHHLARVQMPSRRFQNESVRDAIEAAVGDPVAMKKARAVLASATKEAKRLALLSRLDAERSPDELLFAQIAAQQMAEVTFLKAVTQLYALELSPKGKTIASHRIVQRQTLKRRPTH